MYRDFDSIMLVQAVSKASDLQGRPRSLLNSSHVHRVIRRPSQDGSNIFVPTFEQRLDEAADMTPEKGRLSKPRDAEGYGTPSPDAPTRPIAADGSPFPSLSAGRGPSPLRVSAGSYLGPMPEYPRTPGPACRILPIGAPRIMARACRLPPRLRARRP